jgi:hypothetical protein
MQSYSILVPCKSYISKYFSGHYGDLISLDHNSDFGDTILTKLSSRPIKRNNRQNIGVAFQYYDAELKFKLPLDFFYRIENEISEQKIYNINRYLENVFDSTILNVILMAVSFGVEKRTATEAFLNKYKIIIDDDITHDSIRQKYCRMRKNPTMKNNFLVYLSQTGFSLNLRA